jgi:hypothetical protein
MTRATVVPIVAPPPRPVITGGIPPAVGEMTVGHHLHRPVTVGIRRRRRHAGAMTAGRHRHHLVHAGTTIDATTPAAVMAEIAGTRRPSDIVIVSAATRSRGLLHLVDATSVTVSVLRLVERIGTGTRIVLVIMTAKGTIRGTGIGIADGDEGIHSSRLSTLLVYLVSFVQSIMSSSAFSKFMLHRLAIVRWMAI